MYQKSALNEKSLRNRGKVDISIISQDVFAKTTCLQRYFYLVICDSVLVGFTIFGTTFFVSWNITCRMLSFFQNIKNAGAIDFDLCYIQWK